MTGRGLVGRVDARYLLRFDDLCPTMNWRVWEEIERVLTQSQVKPILAVIPDNRDSALMIDPASDTFWERVRCWQGRGWSIGVHGYRHCYVNAAAGLLGLNHRSEFAGLPEVEQREKLSAALAIFAREGVRPDLWIAPGHSFDVITVDLLQQYGIGVISDGFSWRPYCETGMVWIPQQLWRFRSIPCGIWTVCQHHNHWTKRNLEAFTRELELRRDQIIDLSELLSGPIASRSLFDRWFSMSYLTLLRLRRVKDKVFARSASPEAG